jgi:bifunctional DNA-binding transcriptional regulator/antitoxin component of YhaV-PrlF toxin-antitoxin module
MTKTWTITLDPKGRLTLPTDLLEILKWNTGEPVRVSAQGDTLTLERKRALVARAFGTLTPPPEPSRVQPAPPSLELGVTAPEVIAHGD